MQTPKDNSEKRVNYDNTRVDKFDRDVNARPGKPGSKPKRRGKKPRGRSSAGMNDVSWYNRNPELLQGSARIPFGSVLGDALPYPSQPSVAGIMRISYHQTIGGQTNEVDETYSNDGINKSKDAKYSFVVHANSRNQSYSASDLMLSQTMGASLIAMAGLGIRVYGLMQEFRTFSKYAPNAYVAACGFDYSDLQSTYSTMWWDINQRIAQMKQVWVADDFPLTERWLWMNQSLYTDSQSTLPQIYCFTPESYFVYSDFKSTTGTMLTRKTYPYDAETNTMKWSEYLQCWDEALDSIISSADRGTMYGDILKAYGEGRLYALSPIPIDYKTAILYQPEVLTQIENLTVTTAVPTDITQNQAEIIRQNWKTYTSVPLLTAAKLRGAQHKVLNFHTSTIPSPEDVMVATRLMCGSPRLITESALEVVPSAHGSEVVVNVSICYLSYSNPGLMPEIEVVNYPDNDQILSSTLAMLLSQSTAFDWAPWVYAYAANATAAASTFTSLVQDASYVFGDWANYTLLNDENLQKLHLTAIYSLFGMPTLG